jgi:2-oxoglutarate ferredoxin oxidoreductase subunit gamma
MHEEFLIAGFGGQGVMFAGQLLAYTAMQQGFEVTWIPSYGPEMRGGTAHCYVVISDQPIGSPIVRHPKTVIVFNNPSFEKYESYCAPDGLLAYNASLITHTSSRQDVTLLPVPATALADEIGNLKMANGVMLGAVLIARPILSIDALKAALSDHIPARHQELLPQNFEALDRGAAFAADFLNGQAVTKPGKAARV